MQQWRGLVWGPQHPIVLEEITLQSPPDAWPPVIRLDYTIDGGPGRWEAPWGDQVMRESSIEAAASLWLAVVHVHLMDLTAPPPEHAKAAG
jgi:hypothetical protein